MTWLHIWRANALGITHTKYKAGALNTFEGEQLCQIILKSMHKCKSYGPDKLNVWPFYYFTFKCDLDLQRTWTKFQMALELLKKNICAKLFWNPCTNVEVMARTSSIYDYFIVWSSSVNLTFNLPEQMFSNGTAIVKKTNYAKLFWNPCINVEVMARTNQDGPTDTPTHAHTPNKNCNSYVSLTASGLDKTYYLFLKVYLQCPVTSERCTVVN